MRVDVTTNPAFAYRFKIIDARTGMRELGFVHAKWADDETHELGVPSLSRFLQDGAIVVVPVKVPRVVIDLERDTILINVAAPLGPLIEQQREEATA
jgi:hypothetical protein